MAVANAIDDQYWAPAIESDGLRDGAWVVEATDCLDLSAWPEGTRCILRVERAHPGAQLGLHNTAKDGMRLTAFLTDTADGVVPGQVAGLELRHRRHARVEDRIQAAKNTGLDNLPLYAFDHNAAWLETALAAGDLICWAKLIAFADTPPIARATPETFRNTVLHVAAKITRKARQLHLHIDATWPTAAAITTGWTRLRAAFA